MTQPSIMWTKVESPYFPTTWPPSTDTVWVRYTFAYGSNPSVLMDGVYVTAPLSKTEWKGGSSSTITLSDALTEAGRQGVVPLDKATLAILGTGETISAYCLTLTALPDLSQGETQNLLAYYRAWFQYNGAFLNLIRTDHAGFIDWVRSNQ